MTLPAHLSPRRRRKRILPRVLAAVLGALLLHTTALGTYLATQLGGVEALSGREDTPGETWLLTGNDSREGLSAEQKAEYATGDAEGIRTDTIIVLHLPEEGPPVLVSLPRDSYVQIPGEGEGKLNSALALGGEELLVQTVEEETGLAIDSYLAIGLAGIPALTNAVGGVQVCPPEPIDDPLAGLQIGAGCQELDGREALGYVRTRASARGDLDRVVRQQEYLTGMLAELTSWQSILNPITHWQVTLAAGEALQGDGASLTELGRLALALRDIDEGTVTTVPVADPDYRGGGDSSVLWDEEGAEALFGALREGRPVPE